MGLEQCFILIFPHYLSEALLRILPMSHELHDFPLGPVGTQSPSSFLCSQRTAILMVLRSAPVSSYAEDLLAAICGSLELPPYNGLYSPLFVPKNSSYPGPPLTSSFVSTQEDSWPPPGSLSLRSSLETISRQEAVVTVRLTFASILSGTIIPLGLTANVLESVISYISSSFLVSFISICYLN